MHTFDASSIIHAWDNYPLEQFPPLWDWLANLIASGGLTIPTVALDEVAKKTPECAQWLKDNQIMVLPLEDDILLQASQFKHELGIADDNYHSRGVGENDLLIVATAKFNQAILISNEGRQARPPKTKSQYKIPSVCDLPDVGVKCVNFLEFIKASDAVFTK